jgi:hypothetical protein
VQAWRGALQAAHAAAPASEASGRTKAACIGGHGPECESLARPSSDRLPSCRGVVLSRRPNWSASAAWNCNGDLVVIDPIYNQVLLYSATGESPGTATRLGGIAASHVDARRHAAAYSSGVYEAGSGRLRDGCRRDLDNAGWPLLVQWIPLHASATCWRITKIDPESEHSVAYWRECLSVNRRTSCLAHGARRRGSGRSCGPARR